MADMKHINLSAKIYHIYSIGTVKPIESRSQVSYFLAMSQKIRWWFWTGGGSLPLETA
ncbi:hypothetical protein BGX38DRAFT_1151617 [Terfezia claveryi]|nr:hypothetical protein BGX38DRAFT_1151617 [Terfezia claveryi]